MHRPRVSDFAIVAVVIALAAFALGCAARGQWAIEAMSPDQREFVAHSLTSFGPATTPRDLDAAFGVPLEASAGRRLWRRPGAAAGERVEAWFEEGRLVRLRVLDLGDGLRPLWMPAWSWDLVVREGRLVPLLP